MILVNGAQQQSLPATDRGLHYGDGLFETIAVIHGMPQLWEQHMQRLQNGCDRLGITPPDKTLLQAESAQLCADSERAVLKIIITRGSGGRGYRPPEAQQPNRIVIRYPWPEHVDSNDGLKLRLCKTTLGCNPALAGIKHLNRLEQVIARAEWQDESIAEGLMCDTKGNIIEGTMSNLFCVRDAVLITPDISQCGVAGVMRAQVLALAEQLHLDACVTSVTRSELEVMDEVFITNSILGIRQVAAFENVNYGDNPVTRRLQQALYASLEEM